MGASPAPPPEPPRQLWLDVARPIQPRPPRERATRGARVRGAASSAGPQMELQMAVAKPAALTQQWASETRAFINPPARAAAPATAAVAEQITQPCFVSWLRGQDQKSGAIGELAKAARLDRLFPRTGTADDVRKRFSQVGADGDAYAMLDDAERAHDRLAFA